jgi:hypothetical protein
MTPHGMLANASLRVSESKVTHSTSRSRPDDLRLCEGCAKHFRPKRPWQKQCSPRCRQRAYVKRKPITTYRYYGA